MSELSPATEDVQVPDAEFVGPLDQAAQYAAEVAAVPPELRHLIGNAELRVRLGGTRDTLANLVRSEAQWRTSRMSTENWGE